MTATILKLNAYGYRWHVMIEGKGIVHSGKTLLSCRRYCQRHQITATRSRPAPLNSETRGD